MSIATKNIITFLLMLSIAFALSSVFATFAFAHGGGGAHYVDPADSNCMGQLARLHANGKELGNNPDIQNGFGTNQPHPGLGGPYASIQEQAKAFKAYCNSN